MVIGLLSALLGKTHVRDPDWVHCRNVRIGQSQVRRTFLIIAPGSVLGNWESELERYGFFLVEKFHARDRDRILRHTKSGRVEILLTTFETAREAIDQLNTVDWDVVVVDEVHRIKEPKARVTQALKSLNCRRRIGLSGTLLQNKYDELWCLLDWANPGCLGSQQSFAHRFSQPIEKGLRIDAKKVELARARQLQSDLNKLKEKYVLRRTKDNTIRDQLPKKTDQIVFCHPSQFQLSVFKALLNSDEMQFVHDGLEMCGCGRQPERQARHCCLKVFEGNDQNLSWVQIVFTFLHLFLKVANHVSLLLPYHTSSEIQRSEAERYCQIAFRETPEFLDASFRSRFEELSNPKYSGKMQVLVKMLKAIEEEEGSSKVLLFSYSTHVLDILESFVQSQNYEYRRLDGSTRMESRMELVNEFNHNPDVFLFLISTKAGGLGLNITSANVVIVFDPNWNPSHDLQAQDRAYRLGQTRDVRVYRLITAGTVEENIYLRQVYKQQLGRNAMDGEKAKRFFVAVQGQAKGELFGIKNLLSVRFEGKYLMDVILDRQNQMNNLVKRYQNYQLVDNLLDKSEHESKTEDDASFLEELITDDPDVIVPRKSGMAAVLECTQVVQFHANHELVGGSKLEDQISAAAAKSVQQGLCGEEEMAWENVDYYLPTQVLDDPKINEGSPLTQPKALNLEPKRDFDQTLNEVQRQCRVLKMGNGSRVLYGQTPRTIQDRDFRNMADFLDLSVEACAQHVLQLDLDGRLELLEEFYSNSGVPDVSGLLLNVRRDLQNAEGETIHTQQVNKDSAKKVKTPVPKENQMSSPTAIESEADMPDKPQKPAPKQRYQVLHLSSSSESDEEEEERIVKPPPKQRYQRSKDANPRPMEVTRIKQSRSLNDAEFNYESILNSPKKSKKRPQSHLDTARVQETGSRSNEDYSVLLNSPLKRCHDVGDSLETSEIKIEGSLFDLWVQTGKIKKK
eukprot:TCALIF_10142-PA protein Name:"Similar to ERCC6L2 DNA excision repair protein ERCC-6-like 2 (Bos taurus)" AED:0.30 eAED:0.30 QI:0/0/0/0.5/1/1/2/0/963